MDDIDAVNLDDDSAGIVVSTGVTTTTEAGGSVAVTVTLLSRPTANVQIVPASSAPAEVQVNGAGLTFTPDTWNTPTGADADRRG
ncbi:MAG: hypothetical protein R2854_26365 [Caldilineaceae bacterium]